MRKFTKFTNYSILLIIKWTAISAHLMSEVTGTSFQLRRWNLSLQGFLSKRLSLNQDWLETNPKQKTSDKWQFYLDHNSNQRYRYALFLARFLCIDKVAKDSEKSIWT